MFKLSASIAAGASLYAAYVLQETADSVEGNVLVNFALCAALLLLSSALMIASVPPWDRYTIALSAFKGVILVAGVLGACAAWSIPDAAAAEYLGVIVILGLLPLLGLFAFIALVLAACDVVLRAISTTRLVRGSASGAGQ